MKKLTIRVHLPVNFGLYIAWSVKPFRGNALPDIHGRDISILHKG